MRRRAAHGVRRRSDCNSSTCTAGVAVQELQAAVGPVSHMTDGPVGRRVLCCGPNPPRFSLRVPPSPKPPSPPAPPLLCNTSADCPNGNICNQNSDALNGVVGQCFCSYGTLPPEWMHR